MSRQNENPVYEEAQHDEIVEDSFDEELTEIQAAPAAVNNNARTPQQSIPRGPNGQRFIPPPPPPIETHPQRTYGTIPLRPTHQQDQRYQQEARDAPPRQRFDNPYGVSEPDRNGSNAYKTPLQPHHFEKLTKASQFPAWEKRVKSAISSIPGYGDQLLNFGVTPNTNIQEQILNFLIQTVYETEGFDKISTIEGTEYHDYSTRGRDAWQALRNHYHQVGSARISELLAEFNRPQQAHESGSAFVTRIINKRLEIKQAGTDVPQDHARSLMMEGLREEYQTAISFLRVSEFDSLEILQSKLIQICNSVDKRQKGIATADSTSAHFGSATDALGYQKPPPAARPRQPAPAETEVLHNVIKGLRAHLSLNSTLGTEGLQAVEHALMAATSENRVCYFCNQQGHIASNCPKKRQQRFMQHPPTQYPNQSNNGYLARAQGYQQRSGPLRQAMPSQNGGRNVVPNRPHFQAPPAVTPTRPSPYYGHPGSEGRAANPSTNHVAGHYSQSLMFPGYYNMPMTYTYHPPTPQTSPYTQPAGYYSAPGIHDTIPPYHTAMQQNTVYHNPSFESPELQTTHPPHDSAFMSSEYCDDNNYYDGHTEIHQPPLDPDITFGDDEFDPSAAQFCGTNISNMFVTNDLAYLSTENHITPALAPMANLQVLPITSPKHTINHWLELCSGSMLAGLTAALATGIKINRVTLVERNRGVRYMAANRLAQLQRQYPSQLRPDAVRDPFGVSQDVSALASESLHQLLPVDFIFATPPCQAFSIAGPTPGWESPESLPFRHCVNLIMRIRNQQKQPLTYVIENVPNAASFTDIIKSLGPPIIVEAHRLGSTALRKTAIWTNGATTTTLQSQYTAAQQPGPTIVNFLKLHGFPDWQCTTMTPAYFPKFMSRFNSWAYSFTADGKAGPGLLLHHDVLQEPCPEIKELAMGYTIGSTAAGGVTVAMRHKVLGACMDQNIARWLLRSISQPTTPQCNLSLTPAVYQPHPHDRLQFPDTWIVDGGATSHFTGHRSDFTSFQHITPKLVKGMNLNATAIGTVRLQVTAITKATHRPRTCTISLNHVLYVPDMLQSNATVTRLLSQRASHRAQRTVGPVFIDAAQFSVVDMGTFYLPLDPTAHPNLITLHSRVERVLREIR